jgi:hypothetical protein
VLDLVIYSSSTSLSSWIEFKPSSDWLDGEVAMLASTPAYE